MPERVELWWQRRQRSKGRDEPYPVGQYRDRWAGYPVLIRQYHPDLNHGITLTQIPPAAEVYLVWQCDAGHRFVATPDEQRMRPGATRRRSTWCPECAAGAVPTRVKPAVNPEQRATSPSRIRRPRAKRGTKPLARGTAEPKLGEAFLSYAAPKPASAAEARLRAMLAARLDVDLGLNAVRVRQPFFERLEVWPDIPISELKVAIEYDTTGRDGLEHVGRREETDRHKDRLLRQVGWEVVRIRCGKLQPIGPHDLSAPGVSAALVGRIIDRLGDIRGELIVRSYLLETTSD